jgi:ABC-2 type transport system permease protein
MRPLLATVRGSFAQTRSNYRALLSHMAIMVVNDMFWVVFWIIFFRRTGTVRGWNTERVLLLQAMLTTSGGVVLGFLSNARRIGLLVANRELDALLALPVAPLPHLLVRRIDAVNLGDFVFGIGLFVIACSPTPERIAIFIGGVLAAVTLLTGYLVATGSLAFFAGKGEAGELGFHSMLLFAAYPVDIFSGAGKAVLYTAVPAAFVAAAPSSLVDNFDGSDATVMVLAAAFFAFAGWAVFTLGLRRYTGSSGAWTGR